MKSLKFNYLYYSLIVLLLGALSSCIDDKGNYDYQDPTDVISVTIEDLPETVTTQWNLKLSPTLKNLKEGTEYSYQWTCYPETGSGEIKEIATTKDIDADISFLLPGKYVVEFRVKDVERDVFVRQILELNIQATEILKGWYLLKDKDNMTDFDYISSENKLYENVLRDYSIGGNLQLKGKAEQIAYSLRYNHQIIENGNVVSTLTRQKVFHIISDQDYSIIGVNNIELFKKFDQAFFGVPSVTKPESVVFTNATTFLQNAGKVHTIGNMTINIGLFGYPAVSQNDYSFAATKMIDNTSMSMVFDKTSRSFRKLAQVTGDIIAFNDSPQGVPSSPDIASPNNMDVELIEMLLGRVASTGRAPTYIYSGVAIMKSTTKDEHYIALMELPQFGDTTYPFVQIDTIRNSNHPVLTSPFRAATREGSFIYYTNSSGNELWSYHYVSQEYRLIKEFAANEKVTCIYNFKADPPTSLDQIMIATSVSGITWKMYQFEKVGDAYPDLKNESSTVFEGEGTVRQIFNRQSN